MFEELCELSRRGPVISQMCHESLGMFSVGARQRDKNTGRGIGGDGTGGHRPENIFGDPSMRLNRRATQLASYPIPCAIDLVPFRADSSNFRTP